MCCCVHKLSFCYCIYYLFLRLGAGNHAEFDQAHIKSLKHKNHSVGSSLRGESRFQQSNDGFEVQAASNDSLPKGCNDVAPIIPLNVLGTILLQKLDVIIGGAPARKIIRPIDLSQDLFFLLGE